MKRLILKVILSLVMSILLFLSTHTAIERGVTDASALAGAAINTVIFQNDPVAIHYDLLSGTAAFYREDQLLIKSFYSAARLPQPVTSRDYRLRTVEALDNQYIVTSTDDNYPTMKQYFELSPTGHLITWIELLGINLSTNYMAPIIMDTPNGLVMGDGAELTALWIPFDNDKGIEYEAATINREDTSYEASAFYENTSRRGLVVGSVTHDTWKTGITFKGSNNKLDLLEVYGGVSIRNTGHQKTMIRDVQPHGMVSGTVLSSPRIFMGFYSDWRDGMEQYARANAKIVPKLAWNGGVPFGWNSWGAVGDKVDTANTLAASDFIKNSLMNKGFINDQTTYINLDSYWDSPSVDLEKIIEPIHRNGQKAGIYWAPFVDWFKDPNRKVEGSSYLYRDVWLKDENGNPVTYDNGPYALDPTHPGTRHRMDFFIGLFKSKGFDAYIKLDFLTHGALEGRYYDSAVTTGMQAYHKGMTYLSDTLRIEMGPNVFISQAISPLFPYGYAHARRISCDKFGYLYESRDLLNSIAYGWWMNDSLYSFNDPDHMVLYKVWWNSGTKVTENEAKTRVTSAVVAGTVFLSGDDFSEGAAKERALKYLTNPNINRIARMGKAFRPVEGNTGTGAPDLFVLDNGQEGTYLAVFNYDGGNAVQKIIDLERVGLDPSREYETIEQWSDQKQKINGSLTVDLEAAESKLFLIK